MRQGGLILIVAAGRVRSMFQQRNTTQNKTKQIKYRRLENTHQNKTNPGNRGQLETGHDEASDPRSPRVTRFCRPRVGENQPRTALTVND